MRIAIKYQDRIGLGEDLLTVITRQKINISSIEVEPENIYLDLPSLPVEKFGFIQKEILPIPGVDDVFPVDI